ncbi:MAG: glycosyltransferase [Tepidisphaera sp.]|nr:glycosyltransferase [Tepidisphaera sp.]
MRVLLINWTAPVHGAALGGGVSGYLQSLAIELARQGHEVGWLLSGQTYTPGATPGSIGPCEIRRRDDWRGLSVFEVINSPVISPGPLQTHDPMAEVSCPALEAEFARFIELARPDIVHFHNLEGFSAGCVTRLTRADERGYRPGVLFSLHNYHTVCPRVYLLRNGSTPCRDFQGGHACAACVPDLQGPREQQRRAKEYALVYGHDLPRPAPGPVPVTWSDALRKRVQPAFVPPAPAPLPGGQVSSQADARLGAGSAGSAGSADSEVRAGGAGAALQEALAPLDNTIEPEPSYPGEMHAFGRRRQGIVAALSGCDRVLAVSRFVRDKFAAMGVREAVLGVLPIGTRMGELYASQPDVQAPPPGFEPARPLRLAFMGYHNFAKGLHMLLDSLEMVPPDALAKLDLLVNAKDVEPMMPRLSALAPRLAGLAVHHGYPYEMFPRAVFGRDLGLVPSVWWDNGPQTVLEFLACRIPVLGAAVGGVPDVIRDGVNGRLHRGNDREDLARILTELANDPTPVKGWREAITPPLGMEAHARSMSEAYCHVRDTIEQGLIR